MNVPGCDLERRKLIRMNEDISLYNYCIMGYFGMQHQRSLAEMLSDMIGYEALPFPWRTFCLWLG